MVKRDLKQSPSVFHSSSWRGQLVVLESAEAAPQSGLMEGVSVSLS